MQRRWLVFFVVLQMSGCTIPEFMEGPPGYAPEEGGASIRARFVVALNPVLRFIPMRIYYARLNPERNQGEDLDLRDAEYFASTFRGDGVNYIYALPPGEYVAVMASFRPGNAHMSVESQQEWQTITALASVPWRYSDGATNVLFNEELMRATRLRLETGDEKRIGRFLVQTSAQLREADRQQRQVAVHLAHRIYYFTPRPEAGEPIHYFLGSLQSVSNFQD